MKKLKKQAKARIGEGSIFHWLFRGALVPKVKKPIA
jgi:hypothetical protein